MTYNSELNTLEAKFRNKKIFYLDDARIQAGKISKINYDEAFIILEDSCEISFSEEIFFSAEDLLNSLKKDWEARATAFSETEEK
jgi:hypothetical protein